MTTNAWRQERETPSLSEVFRTIAVGNGGTSRFRRFLAFIGPGYLVAVGYMDPGNWATSLAGGAAFGYTLLFVALLSNIMAILLQSLCARLAVASGRDLAQACRDAFPKWMSVPLWIFAELAIIATDLAEVIGTAIGLNLLFGIPLEIGIFITAADVFLILWLQNKGFRWIEALIISLMALIAACFVVLIAQADPVWGEVIAGFAPSREIFNNPTMLYLALGIIGATVMPHIPLDVAQDGGRDPVDPLQIQTAYCLSGAAKDVGGDFIAGADLAPDAPAPDGVETGPERQHHQGEGAISRRPIGMRSAGKGSEDQVLLIRAARLLVQCIQQGGRIAEAQDRPLFAPDGIEAALEAEGGRRLHDLITDLVPCERHWTPALRPGVQRLCVARSGRRASLRFQGVGGRGARQPVGLDA